MRKVERNIGESIVQQLSGQNGGLDKMKLFEYAGDINLEIVQESLDYYKENYGISPTYASNMFSNFIEYKKIKKICEERGVAVSDYDAMIDELSNLIYNSWEDGITEFEFDAAEYDFYMTSTIKIQLYFDNNSMIEGQADVVEGDGVLNNMNMFNEILIMVNMANIFGQKMLSKMLVHELNHMAEHLGRMRQTSGQTGLGSYYNNQNYTQKHNQSLFPNYNNVNDITGDGILDKLIKSVKDICYYILLDTERNAFIADSYAEIKARSKGSDIIKQIQGTETYQKFFKIKTHDLPLLKGTYNPEFWVYVCKVFLNWDGVNKQNVFKYRNIFLNKASAKLEAGMNKLYKIGAMCLEKSN